MKNLFFMLPVLFPAVIAAQELPADTTAHLNAVEVKAYFNRQPVLTLPATVSVISKQQITEQQPYSLLPSLNAVPGIRMEERSPGSYRLSIRGSLLRSPFGVRNVKIYMNDFLLTDAGGNTYLNALDAGGISSIEILKGPEGSIFGANTGGVILIGAAEPVADSVAGSAAVTAGSFGLIHQTASVSKGWRNVSLNISQAWQRSDGYRENSAMRRNYVHAIPQWNYSSIGKLQGLLMYSDIAYRTPGGLTEAQLTVNPRGSRPAAGSTPGAIEQKAGIMSKTALAGVSNELLLSRHLRHVVALTWSHTDFRNPFITNYEVRDENSVGVRTYFEFSGNRQSRVFVQSQLGIEAQRTTTGIANYGNRGGVADTVQASDDLIAGQRFLFAHISAHIRRRLVFEAAGSINLYKYKYRSLEPVVLPEETRTFDTQFMPRLAMSYLLTDRLSWRVSASRGYSPPAIAEVRASDNVINTGLQPETGWNYETGFRLSLLNNRVYWDGTIFRFRLEDAIVRRLNDDGNEFFINAGGTRQTGFESQLISWLVAPRREGRIRGFQLRNSYTYSAFYFHNYADAENDYSGNRLTGVPRHVVVTAVNIDFPLRLNLALQHNYTSALPLNDAGSVYANAYHLVQVKAGWSKKIAGTILRAYAGADNVLNEQYSLGNDLNAFGSRFFNPAPGRNFFAGFNMEF